VRRAGKRALELRIQPRVLLLVLPLLAVTAAVVAKRWIPWPVHAAEGGVTRLRIANQVILPGVTRLGVNLGDQNYYDSGQILKNLIFRNPGFEGMGYRSIVHCQLGGPARCIDPRHSFQWPVGFWDGANYEVLDGAAVGRRGTVQASSPSAGGYGFALDNGGPAIGAGDWMAVKKDFPGDPAAGWWPSVKGGARMIAERNDLSPETQGHQALRMEASGPGQSAEIKSYFDSAGDMSFLRMKGRFRLSFRAKALTGSRMLHVSLSRNNPAWVNQDMQLSPAWADYHVDFTANDSPGAIGTIGMGLYVAGGSVLLDDVAIQAIGDPANKTAFRDEVVDTLKELRPGVLRMMQSHAGLGSTVDNLLAPPLARVRPGYSFWQSTMEDVPYGIPELLDLCQAVGAEPWIVAPTAMSREEARKLAEYLAGGPATAGGAMRVAAGHPAPWTQTFRTIHIELGNETWNDIFQGESMEDPGAYGRQANRVFTALRAAAGADAGRFDLVVGTFIAIPERNRALLAAVPQANSLAIAPYLMHSVTHWANDDELYGPLLAEPEQMSREGVVQAAANSAGGRQLAVYEVNLHTTEGTAPQSVLDRFTPSAAAGLATTGHMLRMMRDHGIRDQALFSLTQFRFKRSDGTLVRLWGGVVQMGSDGRMRPQLVDEALANRVIRGNMVRVEVTGEDPTHNQPEGNDGVRLQGVHELDAYGFQDGKTHGLVVFNYGLHQARRVVVDGPGIKSNQNIDLWRVVSPGPGAGNEDTVQVKAKQERWAGGELTIPPCSMAVLAWQE